MAEDWPGTVPQAPSRVGYSEGLEPNRTDYPADTGPGTSSPTDVEAWGTMTLTWRWTSAQLTAFQTWFRDTIAYGSLKFNFTHPRSGAALVAKFTEPQMPPAVPDQATPNFLVTATIRIDPA